MHCRSVCRTVVLFSQPNENIGAMQALRVCVFVVSYEWTAERERQGRRTCSECCLAMAQHDWMQDWEAWLRWNLQWEFERDGNRTVTSIEVIQVNWSFHYQFDTNWRFEM